MTNRRGTILALFALAAVIGGVARGQTTRPAQLQGIDDARFRSDFTALTSPPTRVVGSDGYARTVEWLSAQIAQLTNVELKTHTFSMMVPVTRHSTLTLPDGSTQNVYPFWPAQSRVNSTPADGITGELVYCGQAHIDQIPPARVNGNIAVIEASAGQLWSRVSYMGARAILVVGSDSTTHWDLKWHDLVIPVNLPRFYVPPGELADKLRSGYAKGAATLKAQVVWEKRRATNLYAMVRATQPAPSPGLMPAPDNWYVRDGKLDPKVAPPGAVMISAPFDSSGLVPDVARGASQAVQTASALAMLRDASRNPPPRPMVFFFSGGDSVQFLATRNMLMALADSPLSYGEELEQIAKKRADAERDFKRASDVASRPQSLDVRHDRELIDRATQIIETDLALEQDRIFRLRLRKPEELTEQMRATLARLEERQVMLNRLKAGFQLNPSDLSKPELSGPAADILSRVIKRLGGDEASGEGLLRQLESRNNDLRERIDLYHWLAKAVGREPDPGENDTSTRPIELVVGLDLSDRGPRVGPMFYGQFQRTSSITDIQDYSSWFTRVDRAATKNEAGTEWFNGLRGALDLEPLNQARAPQSYLCASMPIPTEMCGAWGVPGFSMITLDDQRLRRDTPADVPEAVNLEAIEPQLRAVNEMFRRAVADAKFRGQSERKRQRTTILGQVVSPAPGKPVPNLPREGFLVAYNYVSSNTGNTPKIRGLPWTLGVRRNELIACDAEGNYRIEGLPRLHTDLQHFAITVYRIDPTSGAIVAATDLGKQSGDIKIFADIKQEVTPLRSLVFNCEEFPLAGLYDPRFLQGLNEVLPLDARRNAEPQRYHMFLFDKMLAGFLEPGTKAYMAFRYGRVGNRLLLLNVPDPTGVSASAGTSASRSKDARGEGAGFSLPELDNIGPLSLITARDFWRLDDLRLTEYRRAGVSGSLIDALHANAATQITAAETARQKDNGPDFVKQADGAWANEARVYDAARDMAKDVIRAAIFLLLLCVPFSFCMERLLIATPNVYKQIAGLFVIFAVMTAALWSFHPAFKISSSPLIIILAFAIIFMSMVVIWVVYGKFDTELKKIRSGRGTAEGASLARASVLMSAVLLGIANMRRRRFRTALTSITVVLITFAVLCFTSSSKYLDTTTLPTGIATAGNHGVMLRQRGLRPMPLGVTESMSAVVGSGGVKLVERWWNTSSAEPKDQIALMALPSPSPRTRGEGRGEGSGEKSEVRSQKSEGGPLTPALSPSTGRGSESVEPPRIAPMQAMLGLSPGESRLTRVAEVIGPEKFKRLEDGERNVIYISSTTAKQLKVKEGDTLRVGGLDLKIAGTYDAADFDNKCVMLSGEPIAPLKYSRDALDSGGRKLDDQAVESLDLDADSTASEASASYEHLSASQFAIVPAAVSQMLPNPTLRIISVRLDDERQVKAVSDELTKRFAVATFAGYDDGVRMVAAGNLSSVSGAGQVAIPLAIAGLIIFNTMMGSIAERRREIHVYTSLGLAPLHVGALFVAEAMTYGLIGTVFGYVIGQGVGTALLKLGWLGNVTLNYSGTSAMLTMGLILFIVLLSALVPARLASKIAAPSIERSWRVPMPKGDEIMAVLPFTINKTAADGALAYLAEFFDAHKEGSIGKFSAGKVEFFTVEEKDHTTSRGLKTVIWLTPFDLGVRQHLMLLIHPGQYPDIYEVQVVLQRLSGDDGSWWRMNRTFLTELRKQFLQWRSLSQPRMLEYVVDSKQLFKEVPERVVTTTGGEVPRLA